MIQGLPSESAVKTAIRNDLPEGALRANESQADPTKAAMSRTEMILMGLRDDVRRLEWQYVAAHSDKSKKQEKWKPLPRPGVDPDKPRVAAPASPEGLAFLASRGLFGD